MMLRIDQPHGEQHRPATLRTCVRSFDAIFFYVRSCLANLYVAPEIYDDVSRLVHVRLYCRVWFNT